MECFGDTNGMDTAPDQFFCAATKEVSSENVVLNDAEEPNAVPKELWVLVRIEGSDQLLAVLCSPKENGIVPLTESGNRSAVDQASMVFPQVPLQHDRFSTDQRQNLYQFMSSNNYHDGSTVNPDFEDSLLEDGTTSNLGSEYISHDDNHSLVNETNASVIHEVPDTSDGSYLIVYSDNGSNASEISGSQVSRQEPFASLVRSITETDSIEYVTQEEDSVEYANVLDPNGEIIQIKYKKSSSLPLNHAANQIQENHSSTVSSDLNETSVNTIEPDSRNRILTLEEYAKLSDNLPSPSIMCKKSALNNIIPKVYLPVTENRCTLLKKPLRLVETAQQSNTLKRKLPNYQTTGKSSEPSLYDELKMIDQRKINVPIIKKQKIRAGRKQKLNSTLWNENDIEIVTKHIETQKQKIRKKTVAKNIDGTHFCSKAKPRALASNKNVSKLLEFHSDDGDNGDNSGSDQSLITCQAKNTSKCSKCLKYFKSSRTLGIHEKHCTTLHKKSSFLKDAVSQIINKLIAGRVNNAQNFKNSTDLEIETAEKPEKGETQDCVTTVSAPKKGETPDCVTTVSPPKKEETPDCVTTVSPPKNNIPHNASLTCSICYKQFRKDTHLMAHQKTHEANYRCNSCNQTFSYKNVYQNHIKNKKCLNTKSQAN